MAADERDVIRVRTNFRKIEDVYLYRLNLPAEEVRERFLEYVRRMNELNDHPEWYNALTTNCTTSIRSQRATGNRRPWDWRILANGKLDELLYQLGIIDRSLPFEALKRRAHINDRGNAVSGDADFSNAIRVGLPGFA